MPRKHRGRNWGPLKHGWKPIDDSVILLSKRIDFLAKLRPALLVYQILPTFIMLSQKHKSSELARLHQQYDERTKLHFLIQSIKCLIDIFAPDVNFFTIKKQKNWSVWAKYVA